MEKLITITVTDGENEYSTDFFVEDKSLDEIVEEIEEIIL